MLQRPESFGAAGRVAVSPDRPRSISGKAPCPQPGDVEASQSSSFWGHASWSQGGDGGGTATGIQATATAEAAALFGTGLSLFCGGGGSSGGGVACGGSVGSNAWSVGGSLNSGCGTSRMGDNCGGSFNGCGFGGVAVNSAAMHPGVPLQKMSPSHVSSFWLSSNGGIPCGMCNGCGAANPGDGGSGSPTFCTCDGSGPTYAGRNPAQAGCGDAMHPWNIPWTSLGLTSSDSAEGLVAGRDDGESAGKCYHFPRHFLIDQVEMVHRPPNVMGIATVPLEPVPPPEEQPLSATQPSCDDATAAQEQDLSKVEPRTSCDDNVQTILGFTVGALQQMKHAELVPLFKRHAPHATSIGGLFHRSRTCSPCIFWFKGICTKGLHCNYCHTWHIGQRKKRIRPSKRTRDSMKGGCNPGGEDVLEDEQIEENENLDAQIVAESQSGA